MGSLFPVTMVLCLLTYPDAILVLVDMHAEEQKVK